MRYETLKVGMPGYSTDKANTIIRLAVEAWKIEHHVRLGSGFFGANIDASKPASPAPTLAVFNCEMLGELGVGERVALLEKLAELIAGDTTSKDSIPYVIEDLEGEVQKYGVLPSAIASCH